MFNKLKILFISTVVLLALPLMAGAAYYISPTAQPSSGGAISPAEQVYVADDFDTYDFIITPNPGKEVTRVTLNGVTIYSGTTNTGGFTELGGGNYQITARKMSTLTNMIVMFGDSPAALFSISRTATGGGAISAVPYMSQDQLNKLADGTTVNFKIVPNVGYQLDSFSGVAGDDATALTSAVDFAGNVYYTYAVTIAGANEALAATFSKIAAVTADAGAAEIVLPGVGIAGQLYGAGSTNYFSYTCAWTASDASLTFGDATACTTTVTASDLDLGKVATLTVSAFDQAGTLVATAADSVAISVKDTATAEAELCAACHEIRNPEIYVDGQIQPPHTGGFAAQPANYAIGFFGADGQAEYTAGASCADCHTGDHSAGDFEIYTGYAESGHGDTTAPAWMHYPWTDASRASCQPCHTTTGYVNAMTGSTNVPDNTTQEVLTCIGCHSNAGTGEIRPEATAYTAQFGNGASFTYPELGASNTCVRCHSGRESGESITLSAGDFSNQSFINFHCLTAGAQVFAATGYVLGVTPTGGYHQNVGIDNNQSTGEQGPCVTCHMGIGTADHTWEVVSHDAGGNVDGILSNACVNCHAALTPADLNNAKGDVAAAMAELQAALAAVGVVYSPNYPYFYESDGTTALKNWDGIVVNGLTGQGKDVMGAAYNYNLIAHDPGAYAHNIQYALELIAQSIDFLNGDAVGVPQVVLDVQAARTADHAGGGGATIVVASESNTCGACHENELLEWNLSAKANDDESPSSGLSRYADNPVNQTELNALADEFGNPLVARSCQACHAPTFEAPEGILVEAASVRDHSSEYRIAGAVSCAGCHQDAQPVADAIATCGSCHNESFHGNMQTALVSASAHNNTNSLRTGYCQRCHTTEGSIAFGDAGYTGDAEVSHHLEADLTDGAIVEPSVFQPVSCAACHDPHTGSLREIAGWDPNGNNEADQFDLCTSCHTYYNQDGVLTATGFNGTAEYYHASSWYRTIPTTHYDDPSTGYGLAESRVEGYVIRTTGESPCFDCHGHELRTNTRRHRNNDPTNPDRVPTIHTEWASSGHAGGLLGVKEAKYDELVALGAHPTELDHSGNPANWGSTKEGASLIMAVGASDDTSNGGFTHYNWDASNRQSCQMCHTSTGFVNYVADPANYNAAENDFSHLSGWNNDATGSGQNELLYCWGCHSNAETGALRVAGAVTTSYGVVLPDAGNSNTCNVCHAGRGNNVEVSTSSRFAGHHAPAAATLYSNLTNVGGEFPGRSYANVPYFAHAGLGADGAGPCVTCHMDGSNHEYAVVDKDAAGVITAVNSSACADCHNGAHGAALVTPEMVGTVYDFMIEQPYPTPAIPDTRVVVEADVAAAALFLEHESEEYQEAGQLVLDLLNNANGLTNYAGVTINQNRAIDNDRRAFQNAKLPTEEKGGFAHNRYYVKRLLFDSIDWLEDGKIDGVINTVEGVDYTIGYPGAMTWLGSSRP
ncbi:MAG: cytochrome c3 family protein [Desulfuromonadales bacterium]|nr:cytochrome c3 family protein [Desulfuromonadales bacterium]